MQNDLNYAILNYYNGFSPVTIISATVIDVPQVIYSEIKIEYSVNNDPVGTVFSGSTRARLHDYPELIARVINNIDKVVCEQYLSYIGDPLNEIVLHPDINKIFKTSIKYHKSNKYAVITFVNTISGGLVEQYYYISSSIGLWAITNNSNLKAFREMRGELTNNFDDIIYDFRKGMMRPRTEPYSNVVSIPTNLHTKDSIRTVEILDQVDDSLQFILRIGNGAGTLSEVLYTAKLTKEKKGIILTSKDNYETEFSVICKSVLDYEQNPYNNGVHNLLQDAQPLYQTNNLWVSHLNRIYVRPISAESGVWVHISDEVLPHMNKFVSQESIDELDMWQLIDSI